MSTSANGVIEMTVTAASWLADATHPGAELRLLHIEDIEWRESGTGDDYTFRGHAAPFNKLSEDLGGFRELIEPGFFRSALRKTPDVRFLVNHDANLILARTASGTLELREDQKGLHVWARVGKTSYARDLRISMQRGDLDQMSFAFTVLAGGDDWAVAEDGTIVRTLRADGSDELFDVSVVTFPAYTQTDASMRSLARALQTAPPDEVLQEARKTGRLPEGDGATPAAPANEPVDGQSSSTSPPAGEGEGELPVAPDEAGQEARRREVLALKERSFSATAEARHEKREIERRKYALRTRGEQE